jgi:tripartite-type tricarboxylate transporter receptor subunit TctC
MRGSRPAEGNEDLMELPRRTFLHLAAAMATAPAFSRVAAAQTYPTRPITLIVPIAAGGTADVIGRIVAERIRKSIGQPIIIENVTGAGGTIGVGRAARAKPDGYTIDLGSTSTHGMNAALYALPYDVLKDFVPIARLATYPLVLVTRKTMPANNLKELITWLKANPGKASAGFSVAVGHLMTSMLQRELMTQITLVPYRSGGLATQDVVAGQIDLAITSLDLPLVRSGSVKAYAVTSDTRSALAPDIPTFSEMGLPALSYSGSYGLFAPKGTSPDVIRKLNAAAIEALADPAVRSRFADLGMEAFPPEQQTPEALDALQKAEAKKWWPMIKEFSVKAD